MENLSKLNDPTEGLKIISAEVENFQGLSYKKVDFLGKSCVIIGPNGSGKSSLLRAIQSPINADIIPTKAVKKGEERAFVKLKIAGKEGGEDVEYDYDLYFSEDHEKGRLKVKRNGQDVKDKSTQKSILGAIGFDVDEFIRLGQTSTGKVSQEGIKKQITQLESFLDKKDRLRLHNLIGERKLKGEERRLVGQDFERKNSALRSMEYTEKEKELYSIDKAVELDAAIKRQGKLIDEVEKWNDINTKVASKIEELKKLEDQSLYYEQAEKLYNKLDAIRKTEADKINPDNLLYSSFLTVSKGISEIGGYIMECDKNKERIETLKEEVDKGEKWLFKNKKPSAEELNEEIQSLNDHMIHFKTIKSFLAEADAVVQLDLQYKVLTEELKQNDIQRKEIFKSGKMPVPGLTFDEDGIYYKELPLYSDQHPSSTIIAIGLRISMALNPNLKCIFIQDGSLLDKKTFSGILKICEKEGYQAFVEMVQFSDGNEMDVVFAEEFIKNK